MVSFPLFFTWTQELQPGKPEEEAEEAAKARIRAILISKFRKYGYWENEDILDCQNDVLMFMEKSSVSRWRSGWRK